MERLVINIVLKRANLNILLSMQQRRESLYVVFSGTCLHERTQWACCLPRRRRLRHYLQWPFREGERGDETCAARHKTVSGTVNLFTKIFYCDCFKCSRALWICNFRFASSLFATIP